MKFPGSISTIPHDILLEIFKLLPFETLHKCKWVSRSWHSLITHQLFPKIIQCQFLGFFHRIGNTDDTFSYLEKGTNIDSTNLTIIDPGIDFLPSWASTLTILDCCNGLILYEGWVNEYYVCNPVTRSWTVVMGCGFTHDCILLDFDPWVSPHFRLVAFDGHPSSILVRMYCSGMKRWVKKRIVNCGVFAASFPLMVGHCTLWNRELYVKSLRTSISAYGCTILEEGYKTIRVVLSESDVGFEIVEFPRGTKMPRDSTYIGRLEDKLCFAGLDGLQIRVWIVSPKHGNRWVSMHEGYIFIPRQLEMYTTPPYIVGFHPLRSAIFIFYERVIFTYDLVDKSCVEVCHIGLEALFCTPVSIFPFLTCSSTFLENRSDQQGKNAEVCIRSG